MSLFGPPNIEKLEKKHDINGLIQALGHKEYAISSEAVDALGRLKEKSAVIPLLSLLKAGGMMSFHAATALGKIGDPRAIEPLKAALCVIGNSPLKMKAAIALASIGGDQAKEILFSELFKNKNRVMGAHLPPPLPNSGPIKNSSSLHPENEEDIRLEIGRLIRSSGWKLENKEVKEILDSYGWKPDITEICNIIESTGWEPDNSEVGIRFWIYKEDYEKCIEIGQSAINTLISELKNGSAESQKNLFAEDYERYDRRRNNQEKLKKISVVLSKIGSPAILPLAQVLRDASYDNKSEYIEYAETAFLGIRDKNSLESLLTLLMGDNSELLRSRVVILLGDLKDPRAVEPLISRFKSKDDKIRRLVPMSLKKIGSPQAYDLYIQALDDNDEFVRSIAVEALGSLKDKRALLPLCEKLCDADEGVRQKTRDVLCQMWDISIPKAISTLEKSGWKPMNDETKVQYWLIKKEYAKCAAVGNAAIEPLINELDHVYYSPSDESEILKALERFGDDIVKRGHKKIDEARESIEDGKLRAKWREDWEKNWGPNE